MDRIEENHDRYEDLAKRLLEAHFKSIEEQGPDQWLLFDTDELTGDFQDYLTSRMQAQGYLVRILRRRNLVDGTGLLPGVRLLLDRH